LGGKHRLMIADIMLKLGWGMVFKVDADVQGVQLWVSLKSWNYCPQIAFSPTLRPLKLSELTHFSQLDLPPCILLLPLKFHTGHWLQNFLSHSLFLNLIFFLLLSWHNQITETKHTNVLVYVFILLWLQIINYKNILFEPVLIQ
jgi:hypothetical protein